MLWFVWSSRGHLPRQAGLWMLKNIMFPLTVNFPARIATVILLISPGIPTLPMSVSD